ncbi:MAG: hypothetical protein Q8920_14345 [Bacillota bacterium]|nr:hypothetical protein [Bacillota bacterium]
MGECICSNCKNLKGIINEEGAVEEYECKFGFPSENCADCEAGECDITCGNFIADDEEIVTTELKCHGCGKAIQQVCGNNEDGEVYCIDCYLKNMN